MIEIEDLHFRYPNGVEALRGITLEILDGEFVAIMGQNGAGKTTLVKHINGLLKPTKGKVIVDGVDTRQVSVAALSRNVGLVFQNPDHQLFSETVEEEIAFALRNFGFDERTVQERINWVLDLLDLAQYRKASPFMLSGGERKRLALASVLAWDPKIIIIDEPTIGQDSQQKESLKEFIFELNKQEKTVIIVSHDVEFVAECKPRIILMSNGRVIGDGAAQEILTNSELLTEASVALPEITQVFIKLSDLGFPKNVIDLYEAVDILSRAIGEKV
ncbi:MAG: ABC transporter ATP-binding protein [Nitrososphaerota archaeon]|nr:energy-coupling factor ABC transporter ATP-binding protein [Candidatus Bathyarchaeota archaeon]MDW8048393.1 ABC transporter ATP-binding protein [Nitrososphaerota archaeon]